MGGHEKGGAVGCWDRCGFPECVVKEPVFGFFVKNDGLIDGVIGIPLEDITRFRILCPHVSTGRSLDPDYKDLSKRVLTDIEDARLHRIWIFG